MKYLETKTLPGHEAQIAPVNHLWALGLFCLMIVLELATKETIAPLASMVCFGIFSQRMRPQAVAAWVILFLMTSLLFLLQPWNPSVSIDVSTAYIRFGTVFVGGIGAVVLSFDRNRIAEGFLQTIRILDKLPAPVIISDSEGCVVFMNSGALDLLDTTLEAVRGASYFSFVAGEEKGRTIQKYFEFVDSHNMAPLDVVLQIKKPKARTTRATLVGIKGKADKLLVATVLSPATPLPEVHSEG